MSLMSETGDTVMMTGSFTCKNTLSEIISKIPVLAVFSARQHNSIYA